MAAEVVSQETTFCNQDSLPSLPVPKLDDTLDKYLKNVSVCQSAEELARSKEAVEKFRASTVAQRLQLALETRAKERRNWLDEWWYDAYTEVREPVGSLCFTAVYPRAAPLPGSRLIRAADTAYQVMSMWNTIRQECFPVMRVRGSQVWDMQQYHHLFNANRVPARPRDEMHRYFATESEGECPTHICVLHGNNVWKIEMMRDGSLLSPDEIHSALLYIEQHKNEQEVAVWALTGLHRDKWAELRTHLLSLSARNVEIVRAVEQSAFIISLVDYAGGDEVEAMRNGLLSPREPHWFDHCYVINVYTDGRTVHTGDHSNVDAIVLLDVGDRAMQKIRVDPWTPKKVTPVVPQRLDFSVDDTIRAAIDEGKAEMARMHDDLWIRVLHFAHFGNAAFREKKIYADTIIQIALQLAFHRLHGRFAPMYETASIRKFFNGRTETVRSRTEEAVSFIQAMHDGKEASVLKSLLLKAYDAHNKLMAEAMNAQGVDRHLFGLHKTLQLFNKSKCTVQMPVPDIFTEPGFSKAGGGGNFDLSTSFIGYSEDGSHGCVSAMTVDGYGTFYKINKHKIVVTASGYNSGASSPDGYMAAVETALLDIGRLIALDTVGKMAHI